MPIKMKQDWLMPLLRTVHGDLERVEKYELFCWECSKLDKTSNEIIAGIGRERFMIESKFY